MKLTRWITLLAVTGTMASMPLFAQDVTKLQGGEQAQTDVPWADQQASLDAVRMLQQSLNDKGYNAGNVDGLIGPKTEAAIRDFQQAQGLQATGEINAETLSALDIDRSEFAAFGIQEEAGGQQPSGAQQPGTMEQGGSSMQEGGSATEQGSAPNSTNR